jgi:hypothetical protein
VIVRLRGSDYPQVTGFVVSIGGRRQVFVPMHQVESFDGAVLKLTTAKLDLRQFERRDGEVLLNADVLGHRLIDVENARLVRAGDLKLSRDGDEWVLGHESSALQRSSFARVRRLKPAQIADLLEDASKDEETEILGQVHADPELEADVFEELDEDLATRLLGARTRASQTCEMVGRDQARNANAAGLFGDLGALADRQGRPARRRLALWHLSSARMS